MLRLADIKRVVAEESGCRVADLDGPSRVRAVAWPRQRAFYVCRILRPDMSFPRIGRASNRDHTTVLYGVRAVEKRMRKTNTERPQVERLIELLQIAQIPHQMAAAKAEVAEAEARLLRLEAWGAEIAAREAFLHPQLRTVS